MRRRQNALQKIGGLAKAAGDQHRDHAAEAGFRRGKRAWRRPQRAAVPGGQGQVGNLDAARQIGARIGGDDAVDEQYEWTLPDAQKIAGSRSAGAERNRVILWAARRRKRLALKRVRAARVRYDLLVGDRIDQQTRRTILVMLNRRALGYCPVIVIVFHRLVSSGMNQ